MTKFANPTPIFLDGRGALLDAGSIYVGAANSDPEVEANQVDLFWDREMTIPAAQPLRTLGGVVVRGGNLGFVFYAEENVAVTIRDVNSNLVAYVPSIADADPVEDPKQPLDPDLTAIAALSTTGFGRSLLTLANAAALKAATGIPDSLPLTGGTVSGNITRTGAGAHVYHNDPAMVGGRVFVTAAGAADPTSQPGDLWLSY